MVFSYGGDSGTRYCLPTEERVSHKLDWFFTSRAKKSQNTEAVEIRTLAVQNIAFVISKIYYPFQSNVCKYNFPVR